MAEATLNDVTKQLKFNNTEQRVTSDAVRSTTTAMQDLTGSFDEFLEAIKRQRLDDLEAKIEARKATRVSSSSSASDSGGLGLGGLANIPFVAPLLAIASTLTAASSGFVGALEGFGPNGRDLARFTKSITSYKNILSGFSRSVEGLGSWIQRYFGIGPDGKNILLRNAEGKFAKLPAWRAVVRSWIGFAEGLTDLIKNLKMPAVVTNFFGNAKSAGGSLITTLTNSSWARTLVKVLRPIAVIFSLFDGLKNAQAEMEDREGMFNQWIGGGIGGFISGTLGSFFGEMFNTIVDIPMWMIKQIVPESWVTANPDGSLSFNDSNVFSQILGGVADFDFAQVIKDIVQMPFDQLGRGLDFIRNLFGSAGTTDEGRAEAQGAWNAWWGNWLSVSGATSNTLSVGAWLINTALHPLNVVLNQIQSAFSLGETDPENQAKTLTERISRILEWFYNLIPSMDDIKAGVASALSPTVARAIGLGSYLPITAENFQSEADRINTQETELENRISRMMDMASQLTDPNVKGYARMAAQSAADQLPRVQQEYLDLQAEYDQFRARASAGGVAATTINNSSPTFESNYFPTAGTGDTSDTLRQ